MMCSVFVNVNLYDNWINQETRWVKITVCESTFSLFVLIVESAVILMKCNVLLEKKNVGRNLILCTDELSITCI